MTHPDGTVSKRTSKSRDYTHAVEVAVTNASEIARLTEKAEMMRQAVERYQAEGKTEAATNCAEYLPRYEAEIAALDPEATTYFVLQWSASLKSASAAARKPFYNQDGRTSRVVEVDQ